MPSGVKNLYENFSSGVKISGDLPCLGKRVITNGVAGPYEWQTYNEVCFFFKLYFISLKINDRF